MSKLLRSGIVWEQQYSQPEEIKCQGGVIGFHTCDQLLFGSTLGGLDRVGLTVRYTDLDYVSLTGPNLGHTFESTPDGHILCPDIGTKVLVRSLGGLEDGGGQICPESSTHHQDSVYPMGT